MNALKIFKARTPKTIPKTLPDILDELAKYGEPRLCMMDREWHCHMHVSITPVGGTFEIKSDYYFATHVEAAAQCLERLNKAMEEMTG